MSVQSQHVCIDCSRKVPARSYRATCPRCHGELAPIDYEPDPSRKIPAFLRYDAPDD